MNPKCMKCNKTVYPTEKIAPKDGMAWHHGCFRCSVCSTTLNLKTFLIYETGLYCKVHVPQAGATSVADSVSMKHAVGAPKRAQEGLATAYRGDGVTRPKTAAAGAGGDEEAEYAEAAEEEYDEEEVYDEEEQYDEEEYDEEEYDEEE